MNNNIVLHFRDKWNKVGNTFARGRAFVKGDLFEEETLSEFFSKTKCEDTVNSANGFWGLVKIHDNSIFIAADRTRSYPLFYAIIDNIAYISDDAYWIKDKTRETEFDEISKHEFLVTGYVTGGDTLYKNVKQIQAGEMILIVVDEQNNIVVNSSKYYSFIHGDYFEELSREELLKEHELSLFESVNRLIKYANGRTIVVPLSGGYDSRLVATVLRKMNYSNVITFTYGRVNNPECLISREVAKLLGYKWIFIPYDNEKSYEWYNSDERANFSIYADNLSTILPDREWPAVWELKKRNLIPKDSIFVPGYSGDFISGGQIPQKLYNSNVNDKQIVNEILKNHYIMWDFDGVKKEWKNDFAKKILKCAEIKMFDRKDYTSNEFATNLYEKWNFEENQIKRMINSVKIYDFFGYKYWLPLWDYEYMNFWCKVPLSYRINKNLYDEYVVKLYSQTANINTYEAQKRAPTFANKKIINKIWNKITHTLYFLVFTGTNKLPKEELRDMDWEQSSGRLTVEVYNKLLPYMVGRSSCATLQRLGYIEYTSKDVPAATLDMLKSLRGK
jgi:asparagine synthase (glutamine-hydrolysing)